MELTTLHPSERTRTTFIVLVLHYRKVFHRQATQKDSTFCVNCWRPPPKKKCLEKRIKKWPPPCQREPWISQHSWGYRDIISLCGTQSTSQENKEISNLTKWQKITWYPRVPKHHISFFNMKCCQSIPADCEVQNYIMWLPAVIGIPWCGKRCC